MLPSKVMPSEKRTLSREDWTTLQESYEFALEKAHSELEWLREQVTSLQRDRAELLRQQQELQQELAQTYQELTRINQELQQVTSELVRENFPPATVRPGKASPAEIAVAVCQHSRDVELDLDSINRIIEMAWEDRTPFEAIEVQFGLQEKDVIALMRRHMKAASFRLWRKRVNGRKTKHLRQREFVEGRFRSHNQKGS